MTNCDTLNILNLERNLVFCNGEKIDTLDKICPVQHLLSSSFTSFTCVYKFFDIMEYLGIEFYCHINLEPIQSRIDYLHALHVLCFSSIAADSFSSFLSDRFCPIDLHASITSFFRFYGATDVDVVMNFSINASVALTK